MKLKRACNKILASTLILVLCLGISACGFWNDHQSNILLIVADDMGYSDLGAFGGEINTPNLDQLVELGVMMTNFHAAQTCSPTRAMLMSGTDTHLAGLGTMEEGLALATPEQLATGNYLGYLKEDLEAFPAKLRNAGYHTYMAGKWHLANVTGGPQRWVETSAAARGFERSFTMLQGGSSCFSDMLGISPMAQTALYMEDYDVVNSLPADFYATKDYTDKLIQYIDENKDDGQPFFAYAAYTAPHWPLQVPDAWLDKYAGRYTAGYDALREERVARMKALGIIPQDADHFPRMPQVPAWDDLTPEQQQTEARAMEIYAAMVGYMDNQIGRLIQHLKDIGEYDNTIIVFMSDNGAEGNNPRDFFPPYIPGVTSDAIDSFNAKLDESYENMGKPGSFVSYNAGWGQVGALPHRDFKGHMAEGGIRVPLIVKYPKSLRSGGTMNDAFFTVMDLAPTFLEIAEAQLPVQPLRGKSMVPFLRGYKSKIHRPDYGVGWEFVGAQAYIKDNYKILMDPPPNPFLPTGKGDGVTWKLFNLVNDQAELVDLSGDSDYADIFQDLKDSYDRYALEAGVVKFWGLLPPS